MKTHLGKNVFKLFGDASETVVARCGGLVCMTDSFLDVSKETFPANLIFELAALGRTLSRIDSNAHATSMA